jgi:hypothetical protein
LEAQVVAIRAPGEPLADSLGLAVAEPLRDIQAPVVVVDQVHPAAFQAPVVVVRLQDTQVPVEPPVDFQVQAEVLVVATKRK